MSLNEIITLFGLTGIGLIVFFESGLFLFFLPGDTLLFSAGILASQGYLNIYILVFVLFVSSVLGSTAGYLLGTYFSKKLSNMKDTFLWNKKNLIKTELFFDKHGNKTILFARFVPVVRTFAPLVAGIVKMRKKPFYIYSLVGSIAWICVIVGLGYFFGGVIPNIEKIMLPVMATVIVLSITPILWKSLRGKK